MPSHPDSRTRLSPAALLTAATALLLVGAVGAADSSQSDVDSRAGRPSFERSTACTFRGPLPAVPSKPIDVLCTDMDLDGDLDVLINWHHMAPIELYENSGGVLERVDDEQGRVGLSEGWDGIHLFEGAEDMVARATASGSKGVFVWHDRMRFGSWRLLWVPGSESAATSIRIEVNAPIAGVSGASPEELEQPTPESIRLSLQNEGTHRLVGFRTKPVAVQTKLTIEPSDPNQHVELFAGRTMVPLQGGTIELWKPDPHGMAWVDVEGTRRPDLFITRGGLQGKLEPPLDPKVDRFFVATATTTPMYRRADRGWIPASYGRGRRVEWVDVDADGIPDLSIANKDGANALLQRDDRAKPFRDRAAQFGIDFSGGEIQTWGDLDDDGFDDLIFLEESRLRFLNNRSGRRLEPWKEAFADIHLPPAGRGHVIDSTALRLADYDNDGDLDLWLLGYGPRKGARLLRRDSTHFTDVTVAAGLDKAHGQQSAILIDVDNDSREDLISFHREAVVLWHNRQGTRFDREELPAEVAPRNVRAAAACDIDDDGRTDLVVAGPGERKRQVLRNISAKIPNAVRVTLRHGEHEPIGTLVKAVYSDGSAVARRYGSSDNSPFSQTLQPLRFGHLVGARITRFEVRWPGDKRVTRYPHAGGDVTLERGAKATAATSAATR